MRRSKQFLPQDVALDGDLVPSNLDYRPQYNILDISSHLWRLQ